MSTESNPKSREPREPTHVWGGLLLVAIGLWSLLAALEVPWASMERLWPLALVGGGAASLATGLRARPRQEDGIWFGVTAMLSGSLFLYVTLGSAEWKDLSRLWPLFVVFTGLGWLAAWASHPRRIAPLMLGLLSVAFGAASYLARADLIAWNPWALLSRWWPLLLIVVGVAHLAQALARRES